MSEQMNVVIESLRAHASKVDGVADELDGAAGASERVSMDNDAYGILCRPFAWMVDQVEQHGIDTIKEAAKAIRDTAEEVRAAAEDYQSADDGNRDMFGGMQA